MRYYWSTLEINLIFPHIHVLLSFQTTLRRIYSLLEGRLNRLGKIYQRILPPPPPVADKIEAPVPVSQFWRDASSEIFVEVLTPRIDRGKIIIYARIFETALSKHRGNCRPVLVSFCSFCLRGQTRKRWAKISCFLLRYEK